mmetsp:Transcript_3127/g.6459  ORF Transcript_3127/g.6459 Transcript_3127/m.6459 type:complete len:121 (+) Transcript_3127:221-583(+)
MLSAVLALVLLRVAWSLLSCLMSLRKRHSLGACSKRRHDQVQRRRKQLRGWIAKKTNTPRGESRGQTGGVNLSDLLGSDIGDVIRSFGGASAETLRDALSDFMRTWTPKRKDLFLLLWVV